MFSFEDYYDCDSFVLFGSKVARFCSKHWKFHVYIGNYAQQDIDGNYKFSNLIRFGV